MVEVPGLHDAGSILIADNETPAWAAPAKMNPDYKPDEPSGVQAQGNAAAADSATSSDSTPAWAAPAKMNPDYTTDESSEPAATGGNEQAAPSGDNAETPATPEQTADDSTPPPTGGKATTEYYGTGESSSPPAWDAPAKMNPDYTKDESSAPASEPSNASTEAPSAPAAEEAPPPPTGGKATTEYYGGSEAPSNPAWAEPAKMNPDYNAAEAPAAGSSSNAAACVAALSNAAKAVKVHFAEDSAALSRADRAALSTFAKSLKDCSGASVKVQGYTDNVGSDESNKVLSELRAKKVADFLMSEGVESSKVRSAGYGPDKPIGDNNTADGRRENRRIELVVSGQ
jgi:outer membrane protein OmpA-like peptidoglycan-associated protein